MAYFEYQPTSSLYHFTSAEGFEGIVRSRQLWLSDLSATNDPRELKFGLDLFARAVRAVSPDDIPGVSQQDLHSFAAKLGSYHRRVTCFSCCFSNEADELPMWGAYGGGYKGVAVGFRPASLDAIPGRLQRVRYLDQDDVQSFSELARSIATMLKAPSPLAEVEAMSAAVSAVTASKHRSWSYEREARIVHIQRQERPDPKEELTWYTAEHKDGTLVRWREPNARIVDERQVRYLPFEYGKRRRGIVEPSRSFSEIILGPLCPVSETEAESLLIGEGFREFAIRRSQCQIR